jgi:DNA-3-methyladenine glycosylase
MSSRSLPPLTLPAIRLAPRLIGCVLAVEDGRGRRSGVIVETEAYPGGRDRASHSFGGRRTPRNEAMWMAGGHAYVYFTYGLHWCCNVVSGPAERGEAVLIRAIEPVEGLALMREARGGCRDRDLGRGPARLTQALGIDRGFDRQLLTGGRAGLRLEPPLPGWRWPLERGPRVGIDSAGIWAERPWRWWAAGHPCVSRGNRRQSA